MKKREILLLIDELLELELGTLTGTEILRDLEGWDSLAIMGFMATVDERFELTLSGQAIITCKTVNDLIALLGDRIIA